MKVIAFTYGGETTELHHLRYFVSVARHLSFTRAAEENRVAQPSLSQQIKRLEELLGAQLFERTSGSVRLTDVGELLVPMAESILKQADDMRTIVGEVRGLRRGRLVVGTLPMTGSRVLPAVVAAFRQAHPGIQVVLREESTTRLTELAVRGDTDLTLTTFPVRDDQLESMELLSEDILLAVPPDHRLAYDAKVELGAVAREPFLLLKQGFGFRDFCLQACQEAGFEPKVAYESAQIDTIQSMAAVGLGVALVPRMAAERELKPSPVFLEVVNPKLSRTLALVWRRNRYLSAASRAFLEVAQSVWGGGQR